MDIHVTKSDNKWLNCQMSCKCFIQSHSVRCCHCFLGYLTSSVPEWCLSSALFMLYYWWWCTKSSAMLKGHWPAIQSALLCILIIVIVTSQAAVWDQKVICKTAVKWDCHWFIFSYSLSSTHLPRRNIDWSFNDKCHHLCVLEMVQVTQLCVHQQTSPLSTPFSAFFAFC